MSLSVYQPHPDLCCEGSWESRRESGPVLRGFAITTKIVIATIVVVVIVISIITIQTKLNVHSRSKQRLERGANIGCCSWTDYGGSQGPGGADRAQTPKSNLCLHLPPIPPSHHCLEQDRETINPGAGVSWNPNLMLPFYFWSNFSNS